MTATAERVNFPFGTALAAAAQLWGLAQQVLDAEGQRQRAGQTAQEQFRGTYATEFARRLTVSRKGAVNVAQDLEQAAQNIAEAWADANWQQQTYAYYAMVKEKRAKADSGILNEVGNYLFGDHTDYGEPPKKPEVPGAPAFAATPVPQAFVPGETYVLR